MFIFIITLLRDPDKIRRENFRCLYKLSFNRISLEISKKFFKFKMSALFFVYRKYFQRKLKEKQKHPTVVGFLTFVANTPLH